MFTFSAFQANNSHSMIMEIQNSYLVVTGRSLASGFLLSSYSLRVPGLDAFDEYLDSFFGKQDDLPFQAAVLREGLAAGG
ncbi:MAG: hypothetical protein A4E65_03098 [Syntrophorhabdus sp. PtaU1.Bin153]|nr:MAG: hypothetical protein A4E65_03098 [Syntrophorhabdus sp. PtaU1.Bin153]